MKKVAFQISEKRGDISVNGLGQLDSHLEKSKDRSLA